MYFLVISMRELNFGDLFTRVTEKLRNHCRTSVIPKTKSTASLFYLLIFVFGIIPGHDQGLYWLCGQG